MPKNINQLWAKMKTNGIKQKDIANKLECTEQYLSMVFNGKKNSSVIFDRINTAIAEIIAERKGG